MTVVLALRCADGIVVASDSQITDPARGVSYPAQKLHPLGKHAAWGGSGSRAVLYDIETALRCRTGRGGRVAGRRARAAVAGAADLQASLRQLHCRCAGVEARRDPATYVLAAGYAGGKPFIVDLDPHGLIGHHEETGFQAVGSGAPMAQQAYALLANFQMSQRGVDYGVVAALRVLDALDATSPTVGPPMDICRITPEGAQHLDPDEVEEVRGLVVRWSELEQRAIDELFS